MSTTVDNRVVEMKFDNSQFESNVKTSMSTLEKLKKSLNLEGASKGLENIDAASKKIDMSHVANGIETVRAKFSALEVMGVTALANITNSAVNAGKRISAALTIDPIKSGFEEYETQINAVQTILANTQSKGTTLDNINKALDELNHYADKTIYNFTEMTRNIGTFTAAGVDLDTSVQAIKGIANLAAVSGSNSQQASTAMYQLSQALAAGTVKLMDWNSVVNAGMGGQVFQDALKETARVHGIAIDDMIKKEGSFRETLQNGWLSSDILTETLAKFTGDLTDEQLRSIGYTEEQIKSIQQLGQTANDAATKVKTFTQLKDTLKEALQSGWTQSWEIMIGDFEEAKSLWTEVSDYFSEAINKSAEARNSMLQGFADGGGREMAIQSIKNAFEGLISVMKPIKEAFRDVFPPMTAEKLLKITEAVKNLTSNFKLNSEQSEKLKTTFKGLFSAIDIGVTFLTEFAGGVVKLLGNVSGLGDSFLDVTSSLGSMISGFRDSIKETDAFGKAVDNIVGFLQNGIDKIKVFANFVKEKFVMPGWEGFLNLMKSIWDIIQKIGSKISEVGKAIGNALANTFRSGDIASGLDIINGGIFAAILSKMNSVIGNFSKGMKNITGILNSVKECLKGYQETLKAEALVKIATAIGILAASIVALALINPEKLAISLAAISALFAELLASMAIFDKIGGTYKHVGKAIIAMNGMATAVLILASALKKLSDLSLSEIGKGLVGIVGLTATVVAASKAMSSNSGKVMKGAASLILFATSLKILVSACSDISSLSWEEIAKGLVGIGALMTEISLFMNNTKLSLKSTATATGIVILSAAIKVLASAVKDFGQMSWEEIGKGLASVAALLLEISAFTKISGNAKHVISTATSLTIIAASMKIFASAIRDFSGMSWEEIGRGLTAMAGALAEVTIAVNCMPKNMILISSGLVITASALIILANALEKMGSMSWDEIGRGLTTLGVSMGILAIGLSAMKGNGSSSAALLVVAAALTVLTPVLKTLGNMSWESIAKGLISIAGAFTVIGVAGLLLQPLVPALLKMSGALVLVGVACAGIGAGLALAATGLTALATAGTAGATAIVASLTIIITGIAGLLPAVVEKLGEAIIVFCKVIAEAAPAIGEALKALVLTLIDVLVECVPQLADGALKLIIGVLDALIDYGPTIVDRLFVFLIGIIDALATKIPELIKAAVKLLESLFSGIIDALGKIDVNSFVDAVKAIGLLSGMMIALGALKSLVPSAMAGVLGLGVIIAELALVLAAIGGLAQIPGLDWLIGEGGKLLGTIGQAIGNFVGSIVGGFAAGATSTLPEVAENLSAFAENITPFIEAMSKVNMSTLGGVTALVAMMTMLSGANIVEHISTFITGTSSIDAFSKQLSVFGDAMVKFSKKISGNIDEEAVTAAVNAGKLLAEMQSMIQGTGGLAQIFGGNKDLSAFGDQLVAFGEAISAFSKSVEGNVNEDAVTSAANAGKVMSELQNSIAPNSGVFQTFTGTQDLSVFGDQLVAFGKAISTFSQSVDGNISEEAVIAAANAGKVMTEMQSTIEPTKGVLQAFSGTQNLETFGTQLVAFGEAMTQFSQTVSGNIDEDAVASAANAGRVMTEVQKAIPESSWFDGKQSLAEFGADLVMFGEYIRTYSERVTGIDSEMISSSITSANRLATLAQKLVEIDPSGIENFKVSAIGREIKGYADKVMGIDPEITGASISFATRLVNFISNMPDMSSIENFKVASIGTEIRNYADSVVGINQEAVSASITAATRLIGLINSMTGIDPSGVNSFISAINSLSQANIQGVIDAFSGISMSFETYGIDMMQSLANGMKSASSTAISTANSIISEILQNIRNKEPDFNKAGVTLFTKIADGMKSETPNILQVIETMLTSASNNIRSHYSAFNADGTHLANGLAEGIRAGIPAVAAAASAMAAAAEPAVRAKLRIHSPSRVFREIGKYIPEGLIQGISSLGSSVRNASASMASDALTGARNVMSNMSAIINSDIDVQPTISPVLDLSNVSAGARNITDMLSLQPSIGLATNAGAIYSMDNQRIQNGRNNDVVSAIDKLRKDLGNVGGDTYQVNGVTYDDGSNVSDAVKSLIRAARIERRI